MTKPINHHALAPAGLRSDSERYCSNHNGRGPIAGGFMKPTANGRARFVCGRCAQKGQA